MLLIRLKAEQQEHYERNLASIEHHLHDELVKEKEALRKQHDNLMKALNKEKAAAESLHASAEERSRKLDKDMNQFTMKSKEFEAQTRSCDFQASKMFFIKPNFIISLK